MDNGLEARFGRLRLGAVPPGPWPTTLPDSLAGHMEGGKSAQSRPARHPRSLEGDMLRSLGREHSVQSPFVPLLLPSAAEAGIHWQTYLGLWGS
jgi:hypothetical protein